MRVIKTELEKIISYSKGDAITREDIDAVAERMENPAFVGFSSYCWSTEYNKLLAVLYKYHSLFTAENRTNLI